MSILRNIIFFLICACISSCAADMAFPDAIYDNNITMGNFVDGEFVTDQGLSYHILALNCNGAIDSIKRAMVSCNIISKVDESRYNVIINDFEEIFTKTPVDSTSVTDEEILKEDPLNLGEIWYSGGYLNILVSIPVKEGSGQAHLVNLVRNDKDAAEGVYEFTFKHNAYGEVYTPQDTLFAQSNRYVSFPLSHLFKEDEKKVLVKLSWTSNVEKEGKLTAETQKNKTLLDIERVGFEHKHQ